MYQLFYCFGDFTSHCQKVCSLLSMIEAAKCMGRLSSMCLNFGSKQSDTNKVAGMLELGDDDEDETSASWKKLMEKLIR